jgi:hypothetical protein
MTRSIRYRCKMFRAAFQSAFAVQPQSGFLQENSAGHTYFEMAFTPA